MDSIDSVLPPSITLARFAAKGRRDFSLKDFDPKVVRSVKDLPPYLLMGDLDEATFQWSQGNWSARWQGVEANTFLAIDYDLTRAHYVIEQRWQGIHGGTSNYSDRVPLTVILGQALNCEFPQKWDQKALADSQLRYKLTFLPHTNDVPSLLGLPDGFFTTIAIPIHVSQLRTAMHSINELCRDGALTTPLYAQAHRVIQAINYVEGKDSAESTDPDNLFVPNFLDTGLLPLAMPLREVASDGSSAWTIRRHIYVICIHVPFSVLGLALDWLAENSELIQKNREGEESENKPFGMRPFVMPAGLDALGVEVKYWDKRRTTRLVWNFSDVKVDASTPNKLARELEPQMQERSILAVENFSTKQGEEIHAAIQKNATELELAIERATFPRQSWCGAGGLNYSYNVGVRLQAVRLYAQRYQKQHGTVPEGVHHVKLIVGSEPDEYDIREMMDHPGKKNWVLDIEITYPKDEPMYVIETEETSPEFAQCWRAAVAHLSAQVQDGIRSWLKADLSPPFAEHLSFRLGNQNFYIQVLDFNEKLIPPGSLKTLELIARMCNGHACTMPMTKNHCGAWVPVMAGWGLINVKTNQPINPLELVTDEKIEMTAWEIQDFAVQAVRMALKQDGYEVMSHQGNPQIDPSIWFVGDSQGPEWIVVRAVTYPQADAPRPRNLEAVAKICSQRSDIGHFASVAICSADEKFDGFPTPLWRGYGMHVRYEGLQRNNWPSTQ